MPEKYPAQIKSELERSKPTFSQAFCHDRDNCKTPKTPQ